MSARGFNKRAFIPMDPSNYLLKKILEGLCSVIGEGIGVIFEEMKRILNLSDEGIRSALYYILETEEFCGYKLAKNAVKLDACELGAALKEAIDKYIDENTKFILIRSVAEDMINNGMSLKKLSEAGPFKRIKSFNRRRNRITIVTEGEMYLVPIVIGVILADGKPIKVVNIDRGEERRFEFEVVD